MPSPRRVLVVEDEIAIALLIEDMLIDLGHEVASLASDLPQALEAAGDESLDLAILDVNLDGEPSYPVAELLDRGGVPVIFASGYGAGGLDPAYRGRTILAKPFMLADLRTAIERALGSA